MWYSFTWNTRLLLRRLCEFRIPELIVSRVSHVCVSNRRLRAISRSPAHFKNRTERNKPEANTIPFAQPFSRLHRDCCYHICHSLSSVTCWSLVSGDKKGILIPVFYAFCKTYRSKLRRCFCFFCLLFLPRPRLGILRTIEARVVCRDVTGT